MSEDDHQRLVQALASHSGFQIAPRLLDAFKPTGECLPAEKRKRRPSPVHVETTSTYVKPRRKRVRQQLRQHQVEQQQTQQETREPYSQLNITSIEDLATLSVKQVEYVCKHQRFPLEDACRVLLCSDDVANNKLQHPSYATALVRATFPVANAACDDNAQAQISRAVTQQLVNVAKVHGDAVIDGWIIPMLQEQQQQLDRIYLDVIQKLLSQALSQSMRQRLLRALLEIRPWSPEVSLITEKLLGTSPPLDMANDLLRDLLHAVSVGVQAKPKEKGFMQILLVLVKKYNVTDFAEQVEQIAGMSDMLLKKSVITLLRNKMKCYK